MKDRDATVSKIDGGWLIRFERRLGHSQDKVWNAIVGPGQMTKWFDRTEMPVELKLGLVIRFIHERAGVESLGLITQLDPPRLIEWEWSGPFGPPSISRWEIEAQAEGCRLIMTQTTDNPGVLARTAAGWHASLDRMEQLLDGQESAPAMDDWKILFAHYVRQLAGLAADARIRREDAMTEACFERTLPHPADQAWAAFVALDKTVDGAIGGEVVFKTGSRSQVAVYDPPKRLEARWSDGALFRFELTDLGGVAQMVLIHREPSSGENVAAHIAHWHVQLDQLAGQLDGKPDQDRHVAELTEMYARQTG